VPDPDVEDLKEAAAFELDRTGPDTNGCRFGNRCPERSNGICDRGEPRLKEVSKDHQVACHRAAA
jgi:ABC-type dipeptide/oligopeptide/nickel transport system ATPase component